MKRSSCTAVVVGGLITLAGSMGYAQNVMRGAEVTPARQVSHLPSLRGAMAQIEGLGAKHRVRELRQIPLVDGPGMVADPVLQAAPGSTAPVAPGLGFDGIGVGLGSFSPRYAPPDTTGAVGATQYVQWVNVHLAVFDKATGALAPGFPKPGNALFAGMGGPCETRNDGDPMVQYDKAANRWVLSQFAVPGGSAGYWQCVAVSVTPDATGDYYRYAFPYSQFNDYPKMGVWSDGYYVTFNMFTSTFQGAKVCAYDRASMLAGLPATQQCFQLSSSYASLLPADIDGSTAPPAGSPHYLVNRRTNALGFWKFHVDWANSANTTLTGPSQIAVAAYNAACNGGACVPQAGTSQKLDSLADRLMFRLAYRNIAGVERLLVNHAVQVNASNKRGSGNAALRWYEIRNLATATPGIFQQSTYSPDSKFRWMGSAAMDKQGNLALGYSVSSSATQPALAVATRLATDAVGTLGAESIIMAGTGSQLANLSRWGDYTHMSIDPVDDCTFWYTGQYLKSNGTWNWSTRIASFKINGCS